MSGPMSIGRRIASASSTTLLLLIGLSAVLVPSIVQAAPPAPHAARSTEGGEPLLVSPRKQLAQLPVRSAPGLPSNGLVSNGIHLGFLPFWSQENPQQICSALGSCAAVWGDYWNISPGDGGSGKGMLPQASYHVDAIQRVVSGDVKGVYAPAVLFGGSMDQWDSGLTQRLVDTLSTLNKRGITVWLRFCYEMNGQWMPYGDQPQQFVKVWRELTNAVRDGTTDTYMFWAPNLWTGAVDSDQGYTPYWPGEQYVDVAGLSLYWFGPDKSINQVPKSDAFKNNLQSFYDLVTGSGPNRLGLSQAYPVMISESSAPYYYKIPTSSRYYGQQGDTNIQSPLPNLASFAKSLKEPHPYARSDDELAVKATWIAEMTGNNTAQHFPLLRAVSWFNYLKKGNATAEVLADFRFVGGNKTTETWLRKNFGNQTAYEQGYTGGASSLVGSSGLSLLLPAVAASLLLLGNLDI
ncbi:hypothetical protein JCM8202v2_005847 [Rhodotorula sphaerocarpa]